jgi:hypothetical protein
VPGTLFWLRAVYSRVRSNQWPVMSSPLSRARADCTWPEAAADLCRRWRMMESLSLATHHSVALEARRMALLGIKQKMSVFG